MKHGQMKNILNTIALDLNPSGSTPYFGAIFYGATSTTNTVVPFPVDSAATFKTKLDYKQYTTAQVSQSTLTMALAAVDSSCRSYCRSFTPRVTVVFSDAFDSSEDTAIRQLENNLGMTVIVVGVGHRKVTFRLNYLLRTPGEAVRYDLRT
ncbi:unnamed protein product [Rotaria sp. Silwood1]|nr:unnamed protein product [Rotaria sp. Silwood1]CAF3866548.1 unnamed protein product [Rotaria sp. Silwood1]CAF5013166.1 unnamed protein product [Rotaria sp. Silwood1]CAF5037302.1 unnamed protein product [Rotaria sp. Silwood1]